MPNKQGKKLKNDATPNHKEGRFKVGNQAGKGRGRPKGPDPMVKAIRLLKRQDVSVRIMELLEMTKYQGMIFHKKTNLPLWEQAIVKGIMKASELGDTRRIKDLLEMVYGPQKQNFEITGEDGKPLIPRDSALTGKKLTEAMAKIKLMIDAKEEAKKLPPG